MFRLKKIYIEITNACNLTCSFCKPTARPKLFLSPKAFAFILRAVRPFTASVCLHVLGEPLLHPDLGTLLKLCENAGVWASLTTNATLIKSQKPNIVNRPALRQVNYSLHSLFEAPNDPAETLEQIRAFISETGEGVHHCLRLWNLDTADASRNDALIAALSALFGVPFPLTDGDRGNGVKVAERLYLQRRRRFVWPAQGGAPLFARGRCGGLRHDAAILADGSVVPCCLDGDGAMVMGNVFSEPLSDILSAKRAASIREGFALGEVREPFCKTCGFAQQNFGINEH